MDIIDKLKLLDSGYVDVEIRPLEEREGSVEVPVEAAVELRQDRLHLVEDEQVDGLGVIQHPDAVERLDLHDEPRVARGVEVADHVGVEREVGERLGERPAEGLPEGDEAHDARLEPVGREVLVEVAP